MTLSANLTGNRFHVTTRIFIPSTFFNYNLLFVISQMQFCCSVNDVG